MNITSPVFEEGASIPKKYTCDGNDISPPLVWSNLPEKTAALALINDDPDAPMGTWDHWILFNLPATVSGLKEAENTSQIKGIRNGRNSWGRTGYGGPCPPSGVHRYFFKLYALDTHLNLPEGSSKQALLKAMDNHILDQAQLMGRYSRGN